MIIKSNTPLSDNELRRVRAALQNHLLQTDMEFSLLLGADNIECFDRWRSYEEILRDYRLLVYPREGYSVEKFADKITFLADAPLFDYAATDIRKEIAEGKNFTSKVCRAVAKYIIQNKLYK